MATRCARGATDSGRVRESHMPVTRRHSRRTSGCFAMVIALGTALLAVAACGGGGKAADEPDFQRIDPSGGVYTIDDFPAAGFKKSKQYDVTGLPGGVDARLGFFGPDPSSRMQYELRFYSSHEAAVQQGIPLAEEVTGEAAAEYRLTPTWEEGARDRWVSMSGGHGGGLELRGASPVYGDFVIFGNVVMLCEGMDSAQSLERCESLVLALREASAD